MAGLLCPNLGFLRAESWGKESQQAQDRDAFRLPGSLAVLVAPLPNREQLLADRNLFGQFGLR
jgi:hypothetical protein